MATFFERVIGRDNEGNQILVDLISPEIIGLLLSEYARNEIAFFSLPIERHAAAFTAQTGTTVFSPTTSTALDAEAADGRTAVILLAHSDQSKAISSVADNAGSNTWVVDDTGNAGAGTSFLSVASMDAFNNNLTPSQAVTITWDAATSSNVQVWLYELRNSRHPVTESSSFDLSLFQTQAAGNVHTVGPTDSLSLADECVFAMFRNNFIDAGNIIAGSGWSTSATSVLSAPPTAVEFKVVNSTDPPIADVEWTEPDGDGVAAIVTYKAATSSADLLEVATKNTALSAEAYGEWTRILATIDVLTTEALRLDRAQEIRDVLFLGRLQAPGYERPLEVSARLGVTPA